MQRGMLALRHGEDLVQGLERRLGLLRASGFGGVGFGQRHWEEPGIARFSEPGTGYVRPGQITLFSSTASVRGANGRGVDETQETVAVRVRRTAAARRSLLKGFESTLTSG